MKRNPDCQSRPRRADPSGSSRRVRAEKNLRLKTSHHDRVLTNLLACPFCGAKPNYAVKRLQWHPGPTFEIWCYCLRAKVMEPTSQAAVAAWNQRR
jgi:hypothetical protein